MTAVEAPLSVDLTPDTLALEWADARSSIPAAVLRVHCRCAPCQSARLRGEVPDADGAALAGAQPVGHYALQLRFADGHDRGIYPWQVLRALGLSA